MDLEEKLKKEIEFKLKELIVKQLIYSHRDSSITSDMIKPDSNFYDIGFDDLDFIELRMAIEETYQIFHIYNEDAKQIVTVGQAVDYVYNKLNDLSEKPGPWRDFVYNLIRR